MLKHLSAMACSDDGEGQRTYLFMFWSIMLLYSYIIVNIAS